MIEKRGAVAPYVVLAAAVTASLGWSSPINVAAVAGWALTALTLGVVTRRNRRFAASTALAVVITVASAAVVRSPLLTHLSLLAAVNRLTVAFAVLLPVTCALVARAGGRRVFSYVFSAVGGLYVAMYATTALAMHRVLRSAGTATGQQFRTSYNDAVHLTIALHPIGPLALAAAIAMAALRRVFTPQILADGARLDA